MTDEHITAVQLDEAIRGLTAHDLAALHARTPVDVADQTGRRAHPSSGRPTIQKRPPADPGPLRSQIAYDYPKRRVNRCGIPTLAPRSLQVLGPVVGVGRFAPGDLDPLRIGVQPDRARAARTCRGDFGGSAVNRTRSNICNDCRSQWRISALNRANVVGRA